MQGRTAELCPHCGNALTLENYASGLTLVCVSWVCASKIKPSESKFYVFYQRPVEEVEGVR